jgi:hypothetical protein
VQYLARDVRRSTPSTAELGRKRAEDPEMQGFMQGGVREVWLKTKRGGNGGFEMVLGHFYGWLKQG